MSRYLLAAIIFLGLLVRIVGLQNHPSGLTPDEASFGYDAYSLLQTGRDQWGKALPLTLESFGDFKMPLYSYLAMPSVALFGLNEFAVRLPNVILGTLAIIATYYLCKVALTKHNKYLPMLASFLLALSPWHIAMSRGAFEANLTTFLLPMTVLFYLKGKKDSRFFILAAIFTGLNIFSYHSARLITPLLMAGLFLFDIKHIRRDRNFWLAVVVAFAVIFLTLLSYSQGAGARISSSGIFSLSGSDQRYWATISGSADFVSRIFYNKAVFLASTFFKSYVSYFSPQFLFTQGPAEATYGMVPGRGVLYLIEALFLGGFIGYIIKNGIKDVKWLILWLVLSPVPASLTIGPGYAANRAVIMVPAITIAMAIGAYTLRTYYTRVTVVGLIFFSSIGFMHAYWYLQPIYGAQSMIYGAKEVVSFFELNGQGYDELIISKKISEPHIYVAFYTKMNPSVYQKETLRWDYKERGLGWVDQLPAYSLGKYQFKLIDWQYEAHRSGTKLLAGVPEEFPREVVPLKIIYYPNGTPAYYIVDTNNNLASQGDILR